jgi:hypothetical protein
VRRLRRTVAAPRWVTLPLLGALAVVAFSSAVAAPVDSTETPEYFRPAGPLSRWGLSTYGDVRLMAERVVDRPGNPDVLERQRATVRAGLVWSSARRWPVEVRAGMRASLGTDRNDESRAAFDNETSDTLQADQIFVHVSTPAGEGLSVGKMALPLALTELLWDGDLRPVGVAFATTLAPLGVPNGSLAAALVGREQLDIDGSWLAAAQARFTWERNARTRTEMILSVADPFQLDDLPSQGYARQNATLVLPQGRVFASDFRIADLQLAVTTRWKALPIAARVEAARNVSADRDRDALRLRLALGGAEALAGLELGWVHQRIEREAVCGAFNSDDWWFHSRARGNLLWAAAGVGKPVTVRASAFVERRDDLTENVHRYRLELTARPPIP